MLEWGESCCPLRLHGALLPFLRLLAALVFSHLSADAEAKVGQGALAPVVFEASFTWQSGKRRCVKFKVIAWQSSLFLCSERVSIRSEKLKKLRDGVCFIFKGIVGKKCYICIVTCSYQQLDSSVFAYNLDERQFSQEFAKTKAISQELSHVHFA